MEYESLDYFGNKPKRDRTVTQNVVRGMTVVVVVSLVIGLLFGLVAGPYGVIIGLVAFLWALPILTFILAIIFFISGKNSEGGVCLLSTFVMLLFGFAVCNAFVF